MPMARCVLLVGVACAVVIGGCGARQPVSVARLASLPPIRQSEAVQEGMASWYGPRFHGRLTANGEVYNQYDLTAAHPTLPLGSRVMVTNLATRQSIEVRINDRGPFAGGRIIDLSYAAARSISVYESGTAHVRVEVLADAAPTSATLYAVQVGAYVDADKAAALKARMIDSYDDTYISPMSTGLLRYYQVRLGPFTRYGEAEARAQAVAQAGMRAIIVEENDQWAE